MTIDMPMKKFIAIVSVGMLLAFFSVSSIANAEVGISIGAGANGSAGSAGDSGRVQADMDTSVSSDTDDNGSEDSSRDDHSASSDTAASSGAGVSFSLTQKEAASASIDAESAELSATAVVTSGDLFDFATSRMKRDTNIANVDASSDHVTVEYKKKAHFLGFIPESIRATANVSSNGSVDIDYPWYRFLFSVEGSDTAKAELQARVQQVIESADLSAGFTAHLEAQLIEAVHLALRGSVAADASSGTTADMAGTGADASADESINATSGADVYPN